MYRVLIVDDEGVIRNGIIHLIDWKALGCEVVGECTHGQEVLAFLAKQEADICVCDVKMPVMDGLTLLTKIKSDQINVKMIMLTAFSEFSMAQTALREGATDYVIKNDFMIELPKAVQKAIAQITAQEAFKKTQETSRESLRAQALENLLFRKASSAPYDGELFGLEAEMFCVCRCEIVYFDPENKANSYGIKNFIQMTIPKYEHYVLGDSVNDMTLVFTAPRQLPFAVEDIVHTISEVTRIAEEFMRIRIKFGIGLPITHVAQLSQGYQQATQALFAAASAGNEILIFTPQDEELSVKSSIAELSNAIVQSFFAGQDSKAEEYLLQLKKCVHKKVSAPTVKACVINLCSALFRQMDEQYVTLSAQKLEEETYASISQSMTLQTLFAICNHLLQLLRVELSSGSLNKHYLIHAIDDYIHQNYCSSLTLSEIANAVSVSPSYVSRLYKKKTGITVTQAINTLRIARAKALLRETTLKAYEIAEQIGIEDASYFTNLFIKFEGISPSEFRGMNKL